MLTTRTPGGSSPTPLPRPLAATLSLGISVAVALAGCSGGDAADTTITAPASATAATSAEPASSERPDSTTLAPPDSSEVTTTSSAPATTEPATTAPTSTTATTSPIDPIEAEVRAAYQAAFDSWTACLTALPNCDVLSLQPHRELLYFEASAAQVRVWIDNGVTTSDANTRRFVIESVEVSGDGTEATLVACEVDATVLYRSSGEVLNDDYGSGRLTARLALIDGEWKITGTDDIESATTEEESVCDI